MRRLAALAAVAVVAFAGASTASASSVSVSTGNLSYTASAGEQNVLDVDSTGGNATITDAPGIEIVEGAGCTNPQNDNTASCSGVTQAYFVVLGDQNDQVDMRDASGFFGVSSLSGGAGNDGLVGGPPSEDISGADGNDVMLGLGGADFFYGGPGADTVTYNLVSAPVTLTLDTAANDGEGGGAENDNVNADGTTEGAGGGSGADQITGNDGDNGLSGGDGGDTIVGAGGNDSLLASGGSDNLNAGPGDDFLSDNDFNASPDAYDGGPGTDAIQYARTSGLTIDLTRVGPQGGSGENDSITGVENARGGTGADRLVGTSEANTLDGANGSDSIDGGSGNDTLAGSDGGDEIAGAAGDDGIDGGTGNDQLDGGDGADTLTAGDGTDHLVGGADPDSLDGGAGDDSLRSRDSTQDTVACGDGFDDAITDPIDVLSGCESADNGQAPAVTPPPGGGGGDAQSVADDRAPVLTLDKLPRKLKRASFLKGVTVAGQCDEACGLDFELRGTPRGARLSRYELTLATRSLGLASGKRRATLKPARRLVGRSRRFTVQVRVTAVDAARNRSAPRNVTIKVG